MGTLRSMQHPKVIEQNYQNHRNVAFANPRVTQQRETRLFQGNPNSIRPGSLAELRGNSQGSSRSSSQSSTRPSSFTATQSSMSSSRQQPAFPPQATNYSGQTQPLPQSSTVFNPMQGMPFSGSQAQSLPPPANLVFSGSASPMAMPHPVFTQPSAEIGQYMSQSGGQYQPALGSVSNPFAQLPQQTQPVQQNSHQPEQQTFELKMELAVTQFKLQELEKKLEEQAGSVRNLTAVQEKTLKENNRLREERNKYKKDFKRCKEELEALKKSQRNMVDQLQYLEPAPQTAFYQSSNRNYVDMPKDAYYTMTPSDGDGSSVSMPSARSAHTKKKASEVPRESFDSLREHKVLNDQVTQNTPLNTPKQVLLPQSLVQPSADSQVKENGHQALLTDMQKKVKFADLFEQMKPSDDLKEDASPAQAASLDMPKQVSIEESREYPGSGDEIRENYSYTQTTPLNVENQPLLTASASNVEVKKIAAR